jgi:peptidyl-prolyl cis-trans isomerase A (cyclophilin A)
MAGNVPPTESPMQSPRTARFHSARSRLGAVLIAACVFGTSLRGATADTPQGPPRVKIVTSRGAVVIELEKDRAPLTTANFLQYVREGFYNGTVLHRVISNFVIQGGGYDKNYQLKTTRAGVPNESGNGLANKRGTVGLARGEPAHSGNAQFYVNLNDNDDLDPTPLRWGYCVFGKVVEGMEVLDRIARLPTGELGPWKKDAPLEPVVILAAQVVGEEPAVAPAAPASSP